MLNFVRLCHGLWARNSNFVNPACSIGCGMKFTVYRLFKLFCGGVCFDTICMLVLTIYINNILVTNARQ